MASVLYMLSDREVDSVAAFDITDSLDLYDPRFGNAGNSDFLCPTCGMKNDVCMGHHASLSLGIHIFHPLMYKESQRIINSTCLSCGNTLFKVSRSKAKRCPKCGTVNHGDYTISANDLQAAVRQSGGDRLCAHSVPGNILPRGYVMSKILVPPIHLRTPEDMEWPTDIQKLYNQLVAALRSGISVHAERTKNRPETAPSTIARERALAFGPQLTSAGLAVPMGQKKGARKGQPRSRVEELCAAYSRIVGAHKNEGVTGVMSGKPGVFRQLMMGKRVELSARAVVAGDPYLKLDQVAVPKVVADSIRIGVACTRYNINDLKAMAANMLLWWPGTDDAVDPINILEGMTFERCLMDGDLTMLNRQPSLSRSSLMCFRVVVRRDQQKVISINPQVTPPFNADFDGDEMNMFFLHDVAEMSELCGASECIDSLYPVQDVITGCYLMSVEDSQVERQVWDDCMMYVNQKDWGKGKRAYIAGKQTTHGLLSVIIPGYDGTPINKGNIRSFGQLDTYSLQLVVERWLSVYGLTVHLRSVVARPVARMAGESADEFRDRCANRVREDMSGTGIMSIIDSGAKGSVVHASHMAVAIGQQYIGGKEGVFCSRSYAEGLTPDEFFGHQMAAREGAL